MLAIVLFLAASEPSYVSVARCWSHDGSVLTESGDGYDWKHDGLTEHLSEGSAGTGVDVRVLFSGDFDRGYPFHFDEGNIIFDGKTYEKGCE